MTTTDEKSTPPSIMGVRHNNIKIGFGSITGGRLGDRSISSRNSLRTFYQKQEGLTSRLPSACLKILESLIFLTLTNRWGKQNLIRDILVGGQHHQCGFQK
ncbi:MAG TPA: hypothetical protein VN364_02525 [Bellilinea sp.]|nr:hypothetical protein [Bellilinea sp.]